MDIRLINDSGDFLSGQRSLGILEGRICIGQAIKVAIESSDDLNFLIEDEGVVNINSPMAILAIKDKISEILEQFIGVSTDRGKVLGARVDEISMEDNQATINVTIQYSGGELEHRIPVGFKI